MNLGVDFGSTYTTMTRFADETGQLQDVILYEGAPFIPSIVTEGKGKTYYGSEAKVKTGKNGLVTYKAFKMLLPEIRPEVLTERGFDDDHRPDKVTEDFLDFCLKSALQRCGEEQIERLVVGVPEVWNDKLETLDGRNVLRNICQKFPYVRVAQVVSEPAAASAFFAWNFRNHTGRDFDGHILLIDYGGGTLDITLTDVNASKDGAVEIKVNARTGAGENTEGQIGNAGILYMESVMLRAIEESGIFPDPVEKDGKFLSAVEELEAEIKTGRSTISDLFDEYGLDDPEELDGEEFTTIEYRGEDIEISYGLLLRVYNDVIRPVLAGQLDKMIGYMEEAGIRYDDRDQEVFKIALTGGFGGYKLVEEQVRETFRFSSMDKRQKDIINVATDREKAVSMGAALVASEIIRIRNTAPYSIGFPGVGQDIRNTDYAFRYKDEIVFDQVYYPHYKKDPEKPIAYFIGAAPNAFVVNNAETPLTAKVVYLKKKYVKELKNLVSYADEQHQTAVIGFSLDPSGILSIHIRPFNLFTKQAEGEDRKIVLDSFQNMFEFSPVEY